MKEFNYELDYKQLYLKMIENFYQIIIAFCLGCISMLIVSPEAVQNLYNCDCGFTTDLNYD
tara:strand:- start:288 stop:470 length:183 start_codon:yes stop_codon:yes gene_type:complete